MFYINIKISESDFLKNKIKLTNPTNLLPPLSSSAAQFFLNLIIIKLILLKIKVRMVKF
jgi:hypothetical protein